ncbi:MAG TPA: GvpL/GvpF family gas vesicle protein [Methylomirabilota bacterium]|nr:GvpL/GvpF family gas vesicle protein [Methylomirabilota bacterium]
MNCYLYAIARDLPAAWRPPETGVSGRPVACRAFGDLVLLSGLLDAVPGPNPRTLSQHHEVVASVMDADAVVPFRYGTAVAASQLDGWMAGRRHLVEAALDHVRDCVEMSVKLLRLDCSLEQQMSWRSNGRRTCAEPPGEGELRVLAEHLADRAEIEEWDYRPSGRGGNVVAAVNFLVPRGELSAFLARIAPIASRAVGIAVVPTGPWPAYSFVPTFERPSAAAATSVGSAKRRAG